MTGEPYNVRSAWSSATTNIPDTATPDEWVEHFDRVFDELAKANAMEDVMSVDGYAQEVANKTPFTKTQVKNLVERRTPDARKQLVADGHLAQTDENIPLDEYVEEHLVEVELVDVSDSNVSRRYRWHFDEGTPFETTSRTHWDWTNFDEFVFDATGANLAKPNRADGFEWKQWLRDIVSERATHKEVTGPRTLAVESLVDEIRSRDAFPDLDEAVRLGGLWMESEDADELLVPSDIVMGVAENRGIALQAMYAELDARDALTKKTASYTLSDGRQVRMWHLTTEFAEPKSFDDDPYGEQDTDE